MTGDVNIARTAIGEVFFLISLGQARGEERGGERALRGHGPYLEQAVQ